MKYIFTLTVTVLFNLTAFSQETELVDADKVFNQLSETGCKCVDTVTTYNKSKAEISDAISKCFYEITDAYAMAKKLENIDDLVKEGVKNDEKQEIKVSVNIDQNSVEYKKDYYKVERYMIDNCPSVKNKIALSEKQSDKSLTSNPAAKIYYSKGLAESDIGNYEGAVKYYKKAVEEDPEFAFAWDNLGLSYRQLNQYDDAIDAYNKSLKIDPNGLLPLQNIAIAYIYKEEYQKAIRAYKQLAKIDNNNPEVFYGIGNIYATTLKEYEKGLDNMCKAYNLYIEQKSPYRVDAEKLINYIFSAMKEEGNEEKFYQILESNNISSK